MKYLVQSEARTKEEIRVDWKKEAIDDLKRYAHLQAGLENIEEEIKMLEEKLTSVKTVQTDRVVVQGGPQQGDQIVDILYRQGKLRENHEGLRSKLRRMDKSLALLTEEERTVLEKFYIKRTKFYIEDLCEMLHVERAMVYRIEDRALLKFTLGLYGTECS